MLRLSFLRRMAQLALDAVNFEPCRSSQAGTDRIESTERATRSDTQRPPLRQPRFRYDSPFQSPEEIAAERERRRAIPLRAFGTNSMNDGGSAFGHPSQMHGVDPQARTFIEETHQLKGVEAQNGSVTVSSLALTELPAAASASSKSFRGQQGELLHDANAVAREERLISATAQEAFLLEARVNTIVESDTLDVTEKAERLLQCSGDAIAQRLPLRPKTLRDMYNIWMSTLQPKLRIAQNGAASIEGSAASPGLEGEDHVESIYDAAFPRRTPGRNVLFKPLDVAPTDDGANDAVAALPPPFEYLDAMVTLWSHAARTFTAPSASMLELLMVAIRYSSAVPNERLAHLATRLMIDADRWFILPSRITYTAYFDVCAVNAMMDVAMRRFVDAKEKLFITPSASMCRALIEGFTSNGMVPEAVAFMARIAEVPVDVHLMNASMEALLLSDEPLAVLSVYAAMTGSGVIPSADTFTLLLAVGERSSLWSLVAKPVLSDMQRLGVKGDALTLNLLLKGLLHEGLDQYARQLYLAMCSKAIQVWPQLENELSDSVVHRGVQLREAAEKIQADRSTLQLPLTVENGSAVIGEAKVAGSLSTTVSPQLVAELRKATASGQLGSVPIAPMVMLLFARGVITDDDAVLQRVNECHQADRGRDSRTPDESMTTLLFRYGRRVSLSDRKRLMRLVHKVFYGVKPAEMRRHPLPGGRRR